MDGNATAKTDVVQTVDCLTGKQRVLRGLRYFCAVFALVFVIGALRLSSKENPYLLPCLAVLGIFCFPPALVTGLGVMAFRQRRRWHWAVMALVAAVCVVATAVAGILICFLRGAEPQPCERVVYEVVPPDGSESPATTLRDQTIAALCRRRDIFGWGKIKFEPAGDSRIVFVLPPMKEGSRENVLYFLSQPGLRVEFRAVASGNDAWIRTLLDEKRAPEHMKTVSTPDGDFWRDIRRAENPGSNGDLPRTIPPGFAARPGFEIWLEWLHLYGEAKDGSFCRPYYLSTDAWTASRPPDARVGKFDACVHVTLAPADRSSFAAFATDPETGNPRRLAVSGDDNVCAVFTPSISDLPKGRISFSFDRVAFSGDDSPDGAAEWFGQVFAAFFSAPLPCTLNRISRISM